MVLICESCREIRHIKSLAPHWIYANCSKKSKSLLLLTVELVIMSHAANNTREKKTCFFFLIKELTYTHYFIFAIVPCHLFAPQGLEN